MHKKSSLITPIDMAVDRLKNNGVNPNLPYDFIMVSGFSYRDMQEISDYYQSKLVFNAKCDYYFIDYMPFEGRKSIVRILSTRLPELLAEAIKPVNRLSLNFIPVAEEDLQTHLALNAISYTSKKLNKDLNLQ